MDNAEINVYNSKQIYTKLFSQHFLAKVKSIKETKVKQNYNTNSNNENIQNYKPVKVVNNDHKKIRSLY